MMKYSIEFVFLFFIPKFKMAKKKRKKKNKNPHTKSKKKLNLKLDRKQKVVLGSFLFLLGLALCIAFTSFLLTWKIDQSTLTELGNRSIQAQNWLSKFGAQVSHFFIFKGFGVAAYSIAFLTGLTGVYLFFDLKMKSLFSFWMWGLVLMIWFSTVFGFFADKNALIGGTIGFETNAYLQDYLGFIGTLLLLIFVMIIYLVLRLNLTPELVSSYFKKTKKEVQEDFQEAKKQDLPEQKIETEETPTTTSTEEEKTSSAEKELKVETEEKIEEKPKKEKIIITSTEKEDDVSMEVETVEEEELDEDDLKAQKIVEDFGEFDPKLELSNYK